MIYKPKNPRCEHEWHTRKMCHGIPAWIFVFALTDTKDSQHCIWCGCRRMPWHIKNHPRQTQDGDGTWALGENRVEHFCECDFSNLYGHDGRSPCCPQKKPFPVRYTGTHDTGPR